MITHISIKDFAIIENLNIEFEEGLNILTGETGVGKSIIIQAISLALGSRADTTYISTGKEKAKIQVVIEDAQNSYIISREITDKGKSVCRINDDIVTVGALAEFAKKHVDIHGQYDNQYILNPENHLDILDRFGWEELSEYKSRVKNIYEKYIKTRNELKSILEKQNKIKENMDFAEFQLNEIKTVNPQIGEDKELEQQINLLKNSKLISENLRQCYNLLSENSPSVNELLSLCIKSMDDISRYHDDISAINADISDCYYRLSEISSALRKKIEGIAYNPEELEMLLDRYEDVQNIIKKYGSIEESLKKCEELEKDFNNAHTLTKESEELKVELKKLQKELITEGKELSEKRKKVAQNLTFQINKELAELGFKKVDFILQFKNPDKPVYTFNGMDSVEFMISTNEGQSTKPLIKVASGGEISRIMLAFKSVISKCDNIDTMIFDEIDTGISGKAANTVGNKLKVLSKEKQQIICITHLPQIASKGDHHYKIIKEMHNNKTISKIIKLNYDERIDEIARFLGGDEITEITRKNAKELIESI